MYATQDFTPASRAPAFCLHTEIEASLPKLRRFGLMLTRNRAATEDLVQDCVVRALAAESGFTPGTNFNAWIGRILRNEFISGVRRDRLFGPYDPGAVENIAVAPGQEDHIIVRELIAGIDRLPSVQRDALLLSTIDGLNHDEVAAAMRCRTGTVKSRIGRARAHLKRTVTGVAAGDASAPERLPPVKRRTALAMRDARRSSRPVAPGPATRTGRYPPPMPPWSARNAGPPPATATSTGPIAVATIRAPLTA